MKPLTLLMIALLFVYLAMGGYGLYKVYELYQGNDFVPPKIRNRAMFPFVLYDLFSVVAIFYAIKKFVSNTFNESLLVASAALIISAVFFALI